MHWKIRAPSLVITLIAFLFTPSRSLMLMTAIFFVSYSVKNSSFLSCFTLASTSTSLNRNRWMRQIGR
uniref:Putative secreted protein n=1 Tax=Anopheles darlingi TaxID=43151 RepID=A0A2M4D621_ANODA